MDQDPPHLPPDQEDCLKHTGIKKCKSSPVLLSRVSGSQPSPPPRDGLSGEAIIHPGPGSTGSTSIHAESPPSPSPKCISVCPPHEISCASVATSRNQQSSQGSDLTNAGHAGFPPTTPPGNPPGSAFQPGCDATSDKSSTHHSNSSAFNKPSPPGFPPNHFSQTAFFGHGSSQPRSAFGSRSPSEFPPHHISDPPSRADQDSLANTSVNRPPPGFLPDLSSVLGNTFQPSPSPSAATFGRQHSPQGSSIAHISNNPFRNPPGLTTRPASEAADKISPQASAAIFGRRRAPASGHSPKMAGKCFSIASIRVYDRNLRCDRCGGGSDLGFFYRCVHNVDARLFESIAEGNWEHFDEIGAMFSQQLKAPERGAAARQDKLSPLNEMKPEQVASYTAPQLATVLRQHEHAVDSALADRHGPFLPYAGDKPYLEPLQDECKATLCPSCGRAGAGGDLSFLSLDGVLRGDIPPSAAVGYGFRAMGERPVANANIVKNLGLRDPKTGLLPEQAQKIKEEEARKAAEVAEAKGSEKLDVAPEAAATADTQEEALVRLLEAAIMGGEGASTASEADSFKTPPETSSNKSVDADDTNEDVIQLYAESSDDAVLSSRARDVESEPRAEDSASVKVSEALDDTENDEVASC